MYQPIIINIHAKDINKKYGVTKLNAFFIVYGLVLFKLYTFKYPKYRAGCEQITSMSCAWVTPCSKQAEHNPGSVAFYANNTLTVFSVKKT